MACCHLDRSPSYAGRTQNGRQNAPKYAIRDPKIKKICGGDTAKGRIATPHTLRPFS